MKLCNSKPSGRHSIWYLKDENISNCLEGLLIGQSDNKLVYKHYTLYFGFCVDSSENELGILDLVQVFVETLDKCFEYASELDLIFHVDKVLSVLSNLQNFLSEKKLWFVFLKVKMGLVNNTLFILLFI